MGDLFPLKCRDRYAHAIARGATILVEVAGYGFSSNGTSEISQPNADGEYRAMERALKDTGLFVSMLDPGTQGDILRGNLLSYKGALFENIVADILGKMERKLYYYHKDSGLELDFLIRYQGECVPVECKAVSGNAQSLKTVMKHPEKYNVHHALKFGDYNIGRNGGILTLPMYMAFLITEI